MTALEVHVALERVQRARTPSELFGPDRSRAARTYRELARVLHPDVSGGGSAGDADDEITRAFIRLTRLWRSYERGEETTIATRRHRYRLGPRPTRGDVADLYRVTVSPTRRSPRAGSAAASPSPSSTASATPAIALLKIPRDPDCSDLLDREAAALRRLAGDGDRRFRPYVSRLIETFRHRDGPEGARRTVNVITVADGFYSLADVRDAYPDGVDPRDAAWMWRRLLVALGFAHRAGVLHGAVLPEHVLIHPELHGLVLVDWCYSVVDPSPDTRPSGRIPAMVTRYADWYPPEVAARRSATPATDLAMAARCLLHLTGDRTPKRFRAFARGCLISSPDRRPDDAWRLLAEFDELLERLYGPRRFRPFAMPARHR